MLIETVGTGQSEIDVAEVADVRVVVTAPGLGDDIQAMKAGLIEIADVMVVNKSDREGADRAAHQLKGALSLRAADRVPVPVLKTTATTGEGMAALGGGNRGSRCPRRRRPAAGAPPPPRPLPDRPRRRPAAISIAERDQGSDAAGALAGLCGGRGAVRPPPARRTPPARLIHVRAHA